MRQCRNESQNNKQASCTNADHIKECEVARPRPAACPKAPTPQRYAGAQSDKFISAFCSMLRRATLQTNGDSQGRASPSASEWSSAAWGPPTDKRNPRRLSLRQNNRSNPNISGPLLATMSNLLLTTRNTNPQMLGPLEVNAAGALTLDSVQAHAQEPYPPLALRNNAIS